MRILKVWDAEYPWDVRVEKVCSALTSAGHEVHLVARNRTSGPPTERLPECTVHRLTPLPLLGRRLSAASQFPAFFNPRWLSLLDRVGRAQEVQIVLCRDLPLAPAAIRTAHALGVPLVLDMAENYPAMIRDLWMTGATNLGDSLVRNPKAVEAVERWTLRHADHVIVVVEESRDRLVRLGFPADRITVVGNTPRRARIDRFPFPRPRSQRTRERLELVYLGLLETARGVATAIEAIALCRERNIPVGLTLIGDGRGREELEERVQQAKLDDRVHFRGFLPYDDALDAFPEADVGLIPHLAFESWNTTIPNKLFDYMAAGLAVVASDAVPTKRVIQETGCGLWYRSGDASHLAERLESLWRHPDLPSFGQAGRTAVRERFNWENDSARLLTALEEVTQLASGSAGPELDG